MNAPPISGLVFHHVGVACRDIESEATTFATMGYSIEGARFVDEQQGVQGLFLGGQSPRLELLQAIGDASQGALGPWIRGGHKMYHLGYETARLEDSIARLRSLRAKLVVEPVPAVAFGGRSIAFLMLPNRLLIELISTS